MTEMKNFDGIFEGVITSENKYKIYKKNFNQLFFVPLSLQKSNFSFPPFPKNFIFFFEHYCCCVAFSLGMSDWIQRSKFYLNNNMKINYKIQMNLTINLCACFIS